MSTDTRGNRVEKNDLRYATLVRSFNQRFEGTPQFVEIVEDAEATVRVVQRCLDDGLRPVGVRLGAVGFSHNEHALIVGPERVCNSVGATDGELLDAPR